ncbi:mucin-3A-like [Mercenaria mercenaria]|uniref:mucin-3A-like n=1 Tax=Mercenaria mercenaria TaxID=6596 RepID=UPI00234E9C37|nr:mucin-3A-like [Mercenaria mercenaria]
MQKPTTTYKTTHKQTTTQKPTTTYKTTHKQTTTQKPTTTYKTTHKQTTTQKPTTTYKTTHKQTTTQKPTTTYKTTHKQTTTQKPTTTYKTTHKQTTTQKPTTTYKTTHKQTTTQKPTTTYKTTHKQTTTQKPTTTYKTTHKQTTTQKPTTKYKTSHKQTTTQKPTTKYKTTHKQTTTQKPTTTHTATHKQTTTQKPTTKYKTTNKQTTTQKPTTTPTTTHKQTTTQKPTTTHTMTHKQTATQKPTTTHTTTLQQTTTQTPTATYTTTRKQTTTQKPTATHKTTHIQTTTQKPTTVHTTTHKEITTQAQTTTHTAEHKQTPTHTPSKTRKTTNKETTTQKPTTTHKSTHKQKTTQKSTTMHKMTHIQTHIQTTARKTTTLHNLSTTTRQLTTGPHRAPVSQSRCTFFPQSKTCFLQLHSRWSIRNGSFVYSLGFYNFTMKPEGDEYFALFKAITLSKDENDTIASQTMLAGKYCLRYKLISFTSRTQMDVIIYTTLGERVITSISNPRNNWTAHAISFSSSANFEMLFRPNVTETVTHSGHHIPPRVFIGLDDVQIYQINTDNECKTTSAAMATTNITSLSKKTPTTTSILTTVTPTTAQTTTTTITAKSLQLEDVIHPGCSSLGWNISVDMVLLRKLYPQTVATNIYFGDNTCRGVKEGTLMLFQQGFKDCLTSERISNGVFIYDNDLFYAIYDPNNPFIIRQYKWTYSMECDVSRNEVTSSHVHHDIEAHHSAVSSHYAISMTFFKDSNFMNQLPGNPIHVSVGDEVYVKVFTTVPDWSVKMRLHTCFTKPNDESSESTKYYVIKDGCEIDSNTHIISQSTHETRFVFQDFVYSTNKEGLNIYCNVTFCETKDITPGCTQLCTSKETKALIGK